MTDQTARTSAIYDAIDAFQRTHRLPGLQHAQIRGLLAEHLARVLPASSAVPAPATDRDTVTPPPALTKEGRLRARVQALEDALKQSEGLAKLGARCFRDHHDGQLAGARADIEGHRFALSVKLGLGTGAPWDAIHERVAELPAPDQRAAVLLAAADELDRYVGKQSSDAAPEVEGARLVIRELRRIAGRPSPIEEGKCGCFCPSGAYRCTQPAGHLGYHRHTRPDTGEWSSWVTGTTEANLRRLAGEAQQDAGICELPHLTIEEEDACEAQQDPTQDGMEAHRCGNCDGIDPDTCLMNADRPKPPPMDPVHILGIDGAPAHCTGDEGFCSEHGFHRHAVARPGQPETDEETDRA